MEEQKIVKTKTQKISGFLIMTAIILVLIKLIFLPTQSTEQREFEKYEKHSEVGTNRYVEISYVTHITSTDFSEDYSKQGRFTHYYCGFDEDYNISLIAVDDGDIIEFEKKLKNNNNKNVKFYGTIIESTAIAGYNANNSLNNDVSDHSDMFENNGGYDDEFSAESSDDLLTVNDVIGEYNVIKLDLSSSGLEEVVTGLGPGAYALVIAGILFTIAFIIIIKDDSFKNQEKEETYYIIE